jgi:hypothetical protein
VSDVALTEYPVLKYGADPLGKEDSTAAIQSAVSDGLPLVLPPGTYLWSNTIFATGDLTVFARGATLKWTGTESVCGFVNTVPINLRWHGGTIDGGGANTASLFGFGASGVTPSSSQLLSCDVEDLDFVDLRAGGWTCQYISSTGEDANEQIRWRRVSASKSATAGNGADIFEVVGYDVECDVTCNAETSGAFGITSAWLKHARVSCYMCNSDGSPADANATLLQAFDSNGPAPYFDDIEIAANGNNQLANGDLTTPTTVSAGPLRYFLRQASSLIIGSSANDVWDRVEVNGDMLLPLGGSLQCYQVNNIDSSGLHITVDQSTQTQAGAITISSDATPGRIHLRDLVVVAPPSTLSGIIYKGTGSTASALVIDGGDLTGANLVDNPLFFGSGVIDTVAVSGVAGYNPLDVATPAVPAASTSVTNDTGVDVDVYVAGGTAVTVSVNGTSTGLASGTFFVPAGGTIELGAYSAAPAWVWVGR